MNAVRRLPVTESPDGKDTSLPVLQEMICDGQIRRYLVFLTGFSILFLLSAVLFCGWQTGNAKRMLLSHDEAVASSLLAQGVSRDTVASAIVNTEGSPEGKALLTMIGLTDGTANHLLPFLGSFQRSSYFAAMPVSACFLCLLFAGTVLFLWRRVRLYRQAEAALNRYMQGDFSCHLPQNRDGVIFRLFASVEELATMLQGKKETEHKIKEFLKHTISDISHQLKTPLAALSMYQEIIEAEPENEKTVREFSSKMGNSLRRMEGLIQSMLKITRLDTGSIVFVRENCRVGELIDHSISELRVRAEQEEKKIIVEGDSAQCLFCDREWTGEAIGNIVKNALDHTGPGGSVRITWVRSPAMLRICISDDGCGIDPEDLHHIFKRFYRSRRSLDTQGAGLGLSLAKSVVEGQGGSIAVQSERGGGAAFTLSFLTEP